MIHRLRTDITLDRSLDESFAIFADAGNLEALTPPELRFEIQTPLPIEMKVGALIEYRIRLFGIPFSWLTEISCWEPGVRFVDRQLVGPFRAWIHEHRFEAVGDTSTRIRDEVHYALPFEPLGRLVHPVVRSRLDRIFAYREEKLRRLLHRPNDSESLPPRARAREIPRTAQQQRI
jgi:ligand-binding SRPBCC domain-containing protein